jgi:threonine dehydratase
VHTSQRVACAAGGQGGLFGPAPRRGAALVPREAQCQGSRRPRRDRRRRRDEGAPLTLRRGTTQCTPPHTRSPPKRRTHTQPRTPKPTPQTPRPVTPQPRAQGNPRTPRPTPTPRPPRPHQLPPRGSRPPLHPALTAGPISYRAPVPRLDLQRIRDAVSLIDPVFLRTPLYEATALSDALGCSVHLKVETLNPVRSFKGRGTETVMGQACGPVVCASAGNLGQALAYSGARRGVPVTVFAAESANPFKVERMRGLGATVHLGGDDIEVPRVRAREFAEAEGAYLVEDSLDLATCEGAATIGLELINTRFDTVLIALGGGALASGVGYVMRELSPGTKVVAIQPKGAPAMALSWRKGEVVNTETIDTIADGVAGRYPIPEVLDDLLEVVDDVILVDDDNIKSGMRHLFSHAGIVAEPSAALGIAAILEDPQRFQDQNTATIICGSNIMAGDFRRWAL